MIPVGVEHRRHFLHDRANCDNIEVTKFGVDARTEVLVGNIAPADQSDLVVHGERFVVHAPVDATEVRDAIPETGGATRKRIEYADLEIRMRIQPRHAGVIAARKHVIE